MADMESRVELNYLLDFYGPLLTEHRQELMRLYCEEDLSQQEIADQLAITRQGVFDAIAKSKKQLMDYENKLGLVRRYRAQSAAAQRCVEALSGAGKDAISEAVCPLLCPVAAICKSKASATDSWRPGMR